VRALWGRRARGPQASGWGWGGGGVAPMVRILGCRCPPPPRAQGAVPGVS
jgi:hypothetical protein